MTKFRTLVCPLLALTILTGVALLASPGAAPAQALGKMKIGVVNINRALNQSAAGERSKSILVASKTQKENELKAKEEELRNKRDTLKSNIMLTPAAREAQEQALRAEERELRRAVQEAQQDLQARERKLTESIFLELRTVVEAIGKEEGYDLILEQNAANVVLYSGAKMEDITAKVIERYNKFTAK